MRTKKINIHKVKLYDVTKLFFDLFFASIFLIAGLPLFLIIALLIKLSSRGPIFFSQERIGKNQVPFKCLKFRTMHPEAEDILENLMMKNDLLKKEFQETHKLKNDPRITYIGKFLRKTSLDELPQLYSVLVGEMTIVGPRPALYNQYDLIEARKNKGIDYLKPGITGLAQINGRDELSIEQKVNFDNEYLLKNSIFFDIKIIIHTLLRIFKNKNIRH